MSSYETLLDRIIAGKFNYGEVNGNNHIHYYRALQDLSYLDNPDVYFYLGKISMDYSTNRWQAERWYELAILYGNNQAYQTLAEIMLIQKNYVRAEELYTKSYEVGLTSKSELVNLYLTISLKTRNKTYAEKALSLDPSSGCAMIVLGDFYDATNELSTALSFYIRAYQAGAYSTKLENKKYTALLLDKVITTECGCAINAPPAELSQDEIDEFEKIYADADE